MGVDASLGAYHLTEGNVYSLSYYNEDMNIEDEILLKAVSDEEQCDRAVKALFLNPRILAPIIKMAIPEYKEVWNTGLYYRIVFS